MTDPHEHILRCQEDGCGHNLHLIGEAISLSAYNTAWTIRIPARCLMGHDLWVVVDNTFSEWPTTATVITRSTTC